MYIDPSAGSLILQLIAAGIVAAAATFSSARAAFTSFVRGIFTRRPR
ncbi:MAG TPA: hypothetical protein VJ672_10525 [Gemmatimonadaceae bacterium]|nr:hypothetical protein [Gemmatimonadaceae bacterium]